VPRGAAGRIGDVLGPATTIKEYVVEHPAGGLAGAVFAGQSVAVWRVVVWSIGTWPAPATWLTR
jgi:hypothetical protein